MQRTIYLEPEAEKLCRESAVPPRIYQMPPRRGREVLERTQSSPVSMYPARIDWMMVNTGGWGTIPVYVVTPQECSDKPDVIYFTHGAGWVFGSFHTHEKLVRELAARTGCVVVFPEYSRSPEARYPMAVEQCYSILCQLPGLLLRFGHRMNMKTLTVAGDSSGGNLAIAMTLLSKMRDGLCIQKQLLYYPVTNACFDTGSYCEFGDGFYLYRDGMIWFWNQYAPSERERNQITASPLRASVEQLKGLPEAMIINGEADVLRDEGQAYVEKLRAACVPVTAIQFQGIIHDFVMLNSLDQTRACRAAMDVSTSWINRTNRRINETC